MSIKRLEIVINGALEAWSKGNPYQVKGVGIEINNRKYTELQIVQVMARMIKDKGYFSFKCEIRVGFFLKFLSWLKPYVPLEAKVWDVLFIAVCGSFRENCSFL